MQWTPEVYLDEVVPPPRATPSDWIVGREGDRWRLADINGDDDPSDPDAYRLTVAEDDVVAFCAYEDHGIHEVLVDADGGVTSNRALPVGTHYAVPGDIDTLAETLEEFGKQFAENVGADIVEVAIYSWSEAVPHRLVVEGGAARFVAINQPTGRA